MRSNGARPGWLEAKLPCPAGCQSCAATTRSKTGTRRLRIGTMASLPNSSAAGQEVVLHVDEDEGLHAGCSGCRRARRRSSRSSCRAWLKHPDVRVFETAVLGRQQGAPRGGVGADLHHAARRVQAAALVQHRRQQRLAGQFRQAHRLVRRRGMDERARRCLAFQRHAVRAVEAAVARGTDAPAWGRAGWCWQGFPTP